MSAALLRKAAVTCAVVLAFGLVGGAGTYLARTQADARHSALDIFDERARLAAGLTGDTLLASAAKTREWATGAFAGPVPGLSKALEADLDASVPWLIVLTQDGAPLGASPSSALGDATTVRADPGFQRARQTGTLAFGDVVTEGGQPTVRAFQPYPAAGGPRVLVLPMPADSLGVLLRSALNVTSSRSYIVDSTGQIIVSSDDSPVGARMPRSAGDDYMVATPVAGSSWRTVIITSRSTLLAPITKTARGAWLVFAAFAAAVLLILIIGATTLIYSARLARARLHDQLTGLPGRTLFLDRVGAAIRHGRCATLFLDLDGFKPVNDTYGHAAGDEILKTVASRLREAVGPGDYVSRFGGDEFLVLCPGLSDEQDAVEVAGRIQRSLSAPYEVAGHTVRIGVSIGIASAGPQADRAEALIQNADLALYRAKNNGRGRVEQFISDLVST